MGNLGKHCADFVSLNLNLSLVLDWTLSVPSGTFLPSSYRKPRSRRGRSRIEGVKIGSNA